MLSIEANEVLSNLPANMPRRNSPALVKLGRGILQLIGWQLISWQKKLSCRIGQRPEFGN